MKAKNLIVPLILLVSLLISCVILIFSKVDIKTSKEKRQETIDSFNNQKDYSIRLDWQPTTEKQQAIIQDALQLLLDFTSHIEGSDIDYIYENLLYNEGNINYREFKSFIESNFSLGKIYAPSITYWMKDVNETYALNACFVDVEDDVQHDSSYGPIADAPPEIELIIQIIDSKIAFINLEHSIEIPDFSASSLPAPDVDTTENTATSAIHISNLSLTEELLNIEESTLLDEKSINLLVNDLPYLSSHKDISSYYIANRETLLKDYAVETLDKFKTLCENYTYEPNSINSVEIKPGTLNSFLGVSGLILTINFNDNSTKEIGVQILKENNINFRLYPL